MKVHLAKEFPAQGCLARVCSTEYRMQGRMDCRRVEEAAFLKLVDRRHL